MSYIRLFENLAVLEKWYGMESRSVMEPAVLLLVSLPCTIGIELRTYVCGKRRKMINLKIIQKLSQNPSKINRYGRYFGSSSRPMAKTLKR